MSDMNTKGTAEQREKLHQERQSRIQQVYKMLAETDEGLRVKDISAKMDISVEAARRYMKELLARDLVYVAAKDGKTRLFKANMSPKPPKTEEEVQAKIEEALPVSPDGKEFDPGSFTPCGDVCRPGDIVWVSSRSGEGQFFRYLVITPWERKAMVLGIFAEGHPALNLNDPNYIYLGNDPETGEGLYADVTNTCQRGYKQFGDLLMHIDTDCMDAVKNRLARVMQMDICGKTIYKEVNKDDPKKDVAIERLKKVIEDKMKLVDEAKDLEKDLRQQLNALFMENVDLRANNKTVGDKAAALERQMDEMDRIRKDLQQRLEVQCETIDKLNEENARLRQEMLDTPVAEDEFSESDEKIFAALMSANADLEKDLKQRYEDEIKTLRQIIFSMINKGGDAR